MGDRAGAERLLIAISAHHQLNELSDDMAARITIGFYADPVEALRKASAD
jgi:predicted ATP-dependent Lon-type protease